MRKVGFFRSIHLKFVLVYLLLIILAMQIIGVYFVGQLEKQLVKNFKDSLNERVDLLAYNIEQEMEKVRDDKTPKLEQDIKLILEDFVSEDLSSEVRVIDNKSRVIGTSDPSNQKIVGKRTTEIRIKRTLLVGTYWEKMFIDPKSKHRVHVSTTPILSKNEIKGAIYLIASMENVYSDIKKINNILISGTMITLTVTALLGIFLAQTITRPISAMRKHAQEMAKGNFSSKVKVYGFDEIGQLAVTFNTLTKKLQEAQATTEGERRKLLSVLTHMTDGVISTDRKGRVILINEPASKMLNVSRETVMGKSIVSLLGLEEQLTFDQLVSERDSVTLDFSTKNKPFIIKVNFSIIQKETGFINGLIAVLYDVTEQEKIDMERKEFVANVSHELRTPLTTMRSYLEALAEGAWRNEEIAPQFLNVTQTETERMIRLVNDLLQLSKLDSKDYRLSKDWIDFNEYFNKIIDRFEMTKEQNVVFERHLSTESIYVDIDPDKITQVLDNIISNAMKYSPEGGKIRFYLKEQTDKIQVSITDEGVGIPEENLANIFERFYRVDKARTRQLGGTGLGLAIAKEMIEAHDGEIWAESEEGVGTKIFFTLPLENAQEDDWS
ncbi:cell wall metabolism sensor histidine kinase WalK [Bacillus luteolus]|uniref:histidine kinase n=1 Tax=Litchfieldia luteola TaxID=682179 RepID=A0ABR9QHH9_9BACI|nr:cell wall metabolism sensor histidine kinase WalK [Cytobacillus luteolus]MBE4907891.1 cell wall metabolism sensor histidine kinase WalK [Cytobacillus luteolus]MBP1943951.1 two-component system sensor histidine kinase VicK [Cytobacillus luteolus]